MYPMMRPFASGLAACCGTGAMAGLAHRNGRIRPIGDVQAEGMQGVREMVGFEPMAGDAGFLANRSCVRRLRVLGDVRIGESGRRPRKIAAITRDRPRKDSSTEATW